MQFSNEKLKKNSMEGLSLAPPQTSPPLLRQTENETTSMSALPAAKILDTPIARCMRVNALLLGHHVCLRL